jgi:hypothetical protein
MKDEKYIFTALGVYLIGYDLERLEWAINSHEVPSQLATFFEPLRVYEQVRSFEDIGKEAKQNHDKLLNSEESAVSETTRDRLRDLKTRWDAMIRERLQNLYLVTPVSRIEAKKLIGGIKEFLSEEFVSFLEEIEVIDLTEATSCILVGSATAAEHITLRAAESILRRWYYYKTDIKLEYKAWGAVLDKLSKEYPEEAKRPREIAVLGYLKIRRDEVAHPERISTLTEAESTLLTVCSLIERVKPIVTSLASKRKRKKKLT